MTVSVIHSIDVKVERLLAGRAGARKGEVVKADPVLVSDPDMSRN